jgi:perosamine synthetase
LKEENFIPVNKPLLDGNEKKYLAECIDSGWISSEGPFVSEFEEKFAKRVSRNYGIAVSNGSVAIDAALEALEVGPGDEVIMPSFTIISCINHIVRKGAYPILIDSDPITWNMDVNQIEQHITKKTKVIMVVHIYGLPVDINPILSLAKKYNLKILEDAAEMHGQTYRNFPCGSFGDISTFSFYPNKHITTGEGGMIVTNDENLYNKCRSLRNLCFGKKDRFIHENLGWNMRMTNMQAAIGLAQLERLDEFVQIKRKMGQLYSELLSGIDEIQLPLDETEYSKNIYWVYGLVLKQNSKKNVSDIISYLKENGVGSRNFFYPMHKQPILIQKGYFKNVSLPNSEYLSNYGFYIPSGLNLYELEIRKVAKILLNYFK